MIKSYKNLCEILNRTEQKYLEETKQNIGEDLAYAALITFISFVMKWLVFSLMLRSIDKKIEDTKMSKKLQKITGDPNVTVWKVKSSEVNAFNAGSSKMYYYTGLVKELKLTEGELMAVMLHEYGHYRGKHILKKELAYYPSSFILTFIFGYMSKRGAIHGAYLAILPLHILMKIYDVTFGRKHELESDRVMVEFGYKKEALSAFKKLYKYVRHEVCRQMNIPENSQSCTDLITELHSLDEHPTFEKRLEEIKNTKAIKALTRMLMAKLKNVLPFIKK